VCQPGVTAGANGCVVCVWCVGDDGCVNPVSPLGLMVVWCVSILVLYVILIDYGK